MKAIGPWLVGAGVVVILIGLLAWAGGLSWFGQLPGDIRIGGRNVRVFVPITSMIVVSIVLTIVLSALASIFRR